MTEPIRHRLIIAGSRDCTKEEVYAALEDLKTDRISEVVSGCQGSWDWKIQAYRGADYWGEQWAAERGIKVVRFPAQWAKHGLQAGPIRNRAMADYGTALRAIWNGVTTGTKGMIGEMDQRGKPVSIKLIARPSPAAPANPQSPRT